ncbi:hypothetical protein P168DRAFT_278780 [Aspergillus campestris IBT 28561]|uniref:BZIP domain-containing protein n=1 Tax=Aspergillus campestris (strain IBT 28561) TaxID=1392248 RepID=A0A2I1DHD4_ASPC2|nr:uncharacterized protein P168DRAFT_278780 [Aspergillus campestris IBT 28561]PKY09283.1 hypothetical protein P168DRAFT_278780 [Aspergillus campestris IBT 28561]
MSAKRTAADLSVPELTENAAERKRVLNILAQRRYRQRRKDRLRALESRATDETGGKQTTAETSCLSVDSGQSLRESEGGSSPSGTVQSGSLVYDAQATSSDEPARDVFQDDNAHVGSGSIQPITPSGCDFVDSSSRFLFQSSLIPSSLSAFPCGDTNEISQYLWPEFDVQGQAIGDSGDGVTMSVFENVSSLRDICAELQSSEASLFTFPDDYTIHIPTLTLLNAAMSVARRLGLSEIIWDLTSVSPFYEERGTPASGLSTPSLVTYQSNAASTTPSETADSAGSGQKAYLSTLPPHLQPTPTQRLIPHHPMLDLLPWPNVRDKLIQVFHLPVSQRPKTAQDPMGILRLVYDMEDAGGEGINVHGQDPFQASGWEVGQLVFERWWWAFETDIVQTSNQARKKRGAKVLSLTGLQM